MAEGLIEPSVVNPLMAQAAYLAPTQGRCQTCATRNLLQNPSSRSPVKEKLVSYHHPHRDILEHVHDKAGFVQQLARKNGGLLTSIFPDITGQGDSVVNSPVVSASLARRGVANLLDGVAVPTGSRDKQHHHHYHVHTHHHYPSGDGKPKSRVATISISRQPNPRAKKSIVSKFAQPGVVISGTENRTKNPRLSAKPKKSSVGSESAESLPGIKVLSLRKVTPPRKDTYLVKSPKVVSSGKRKHSNGNRKITPPKRTMVASKVKKMTPPKKISNTSNPVTSTLLTPQKPKVSNCVAIQTTNSLLDLPGPASMADQNTKKKLPGSSVKKKQQTMLEQDQKTRALPVQNFVAHSPPPPPPSSSDSKSKENKKEKSAILKDRIKESREKKGFPYAQISEVPLNSGNFPNQQDDVHIYIAPHNPLVNKTFEDAKLDRPRRRWFENSYEFRARTAPNSPLSQRRDQASRMGKTTTTTEVRTFKRGDRWYKETKVTTVVEHKTGTNTSTKTTTQELPGPPNDGTSSSASSRSPSPARATSKRSASGGLLSKLKDKVTGGSSSSSSDDEDEMDEKLAKLMLAKVNEKRALHGVKALTLSDTLNQQAKDWAKHLAAQDRMEHKNAPNKGENIYKLSSNAPITWKFRMQADPVAHWYEEEKLHKYGQEPSAGKLDSGHFSQLIWKDTKQFGFGSERSASGLSVYFVAFFNPKGNWKGEFTDQVPPVGGFPKSGRFSSVTSKLQQTAFNASSSSSSDEEEDFAAAVLSAHNQYRLKHGVPPLTLSKKLNKTAEEWAKIISKRDRLEHRPNNQYGENIYAKWNSRPIQSLSGKEPVDSWYSEVKNHVFGKEPPSLATGHFTQVVWEDSKELGVGVAKNKNSGKIFVVCNYNPPGNIMGSFAAKVPKAKS